MYILISRSPESQSYVSADLRRSNLRSVVERQQARGPNRAPVGYAMNPESPSLRCGENDLRRYHVNIVAGIDQATAKLCEVLLHPSTPAQLLMNQSQSQGWYSNTLDRSDDTRIAPTTVAVLMFQS